ncbi:MAG: riboflavin biosynthesis protein RibF [Synergistaceae bacterium]|jgi:riboflavin kinase/FMN adenylyltransferase|nr:riboflavin biosynthesis protein RibF [Synergistaceae bacterium]
MIAAIGAFDGFHRGHQALLERASESAQRLNTTWGVITFSGHPDIVLGSGGFKALFTVREQSALERLFSVPEVHRLHFTREMANMTPHDFLDLISRDFGVTGVVVGEDFRFGRNRSGTCDILRNECVRRGWSADIVPDLSTDDHTVISSTAIRDAVVSGEIARAWEMLGYPFFYMSRVVHGKGRGKKLGFPTANIELAPEKIRPMNGVYATLVSVDGQLWSGAANIGRNPTFEDVDGISFEINLTDYSGDLYDRELSIFMLEFIRRERKFKNSYDLSCQINMDTKIINEITELSHITHKFLWEKFRTL